MAALPDELVIRFDEDTMQAVRALTAALFKTAQPIHLKSIMDAGMFCQQCGWLGTVKDCEPDVDGDGSLGCPRCDSVVGSVE